MIKRDTSLLLRGIAILIVIASHYAEWMFVEPVHLRAREVVSTWGPPGVDIFFMLSGYGLYKSAQRNAVKDSQSAAERSGITMRFVLKRIVSAAVPYYIIALLINIYSGAFRQAAAEGTVRGAVKAYITAADFWYISVIFFMYAAFILCFRFGGRLRIPLTAAAVVIYTVWLYNTDHADFWELSNACFITGICAGALERCFPEFLKGRRFKTCLCIIGAAGFILSFLMMEKAGGSGVPDSFGWELSMNIFFGIIVWFIAVIMPVQIRHLRVLRSFGEASLFIYLLHAVMFWALIFKFESLSYAAAAAVTGMITLMTSTALGLVYNNFTRRIL